MSSDNFTQNGKASNSKSCCVPVAADTDDDEYWNCKDRLTWRMDPEESLSDHTIHIVLIDDEDTNTETKKDKKIHGSYHVHRAVLAFGPKKSEYWSRLFRGPHSFAEAASRTSEIPLVCLAAEAFPVFLDYMYAPRDDEPNISAANVTALHHLAQYFRVPRLRCKAQEFLQRDMNRDNVEGESVLDDLGRYYEQAKLFRDAEIQQAVIEKVTHEIVRSGKSSKNINHMSIGPHQLVKVSDDEFWLEILKRNGGQANLCLENILAEYCMLHRHDMEPSTFLELTHSDYLPELSGVDAALGLMEAGCTIFTDRSPDAHLLHSLEERVVVQLATHWEYVLALGTNALPSNLHASTLAKLYQHSLQHAAAEKQALHDRLLQMDRLSPTSIIVADAGLANVNGIYHRKAEFRCGAPVFVKRGSSFQLEICLENPHWWSISKFYSLRHEVGSVLLPPRTGWQRSFVARNGANQSMPTLTYIYDETNVTDIHKDMLVTNLPRVLVAPASAGLLFGERDIAAALSHSGNNNAKG